MAEQTTQQVPTAPTVQAVPQAAGPNSVGVSQEEPSKKGPGLLWLAIILAVVILGVGAYFLYAGQQKSSENVSNIQPNLATGQSKPNQGFVSSTPTPLATPTITSSDSVADIDKDLSGVVIEAGNSSEFTADLQTL